MRKPTIEELALVLEEAWSHDTSVIKDLWSPLNRPLGQCAVTALVVQDYFGGDLLRAEVFPGDPGAIPREKVSHYWNRIHGTFDVDLTASQFPLAAARGPAVKRERTYAMSSPDTAARYAILRRRVDTLLDAR